MIYEDSDQCNTRDNELGAILTLNTLYFKRSSGSYLIQCQLELESLNMQLRLFGASV